MYRCRQSPASGKCSSSTRCPVPAQWYRLYSISVPYILSGDQHANVVFDCYPTKTWMSHMTGESYNTLGGSPAVRPYDSIKVPVYWNKFLSEALLNLRISEALPKYRVIY